MIATWILLALCIIYIIFSVIYYIKFKKNSNNLKELQKANNNIKKIIAHNEEHIKEQEQIINNADEKINNLTIEVGKKIIELKDAKEKINETNFQLQNLITLYNQQEKESIEILKVKIAEEKEKLTNEMQADFSQQQAVIQARRQQLEEEYNKEKEHFNEILQDYQSKRDSIIKISKEEEEIRQKSKFYTLEISPSDLADITILDQVKPNLSKPDILSKLIYKTYYEKPYTDLVGRVIGTKKVTGIYKITNLINNKVYIGQAVDIAERWRQHIKRAVGAEPMTTNKLYPIMQETGPFNFSWQVVEECKKEELTAKEKYWIQYYDGQGYGYNIKG